MRREERSGQGDGGADGGLEARPSGEKEPVSGLNSISSE